jgi:dsRNA-specific ribonuclease
VGTTVRTGTRDQKIALLEAIRQALPETVRYAPQHHARMSNDTSSNSWPPPELGKYASALKEFGDQHAFTPVYTYQTLSVSPPKFQATLSCGEVMFKGTGRNKKQARHAAAYEACKDFKVLFE